MLILQPRPRPIGDAILRRMADVVVESDPTWPAQFEAMRSDLSRALAPWLDGGVHHIGSTAVAGLPAKPILDMLAGVRSLGDADEAAPDLAALGYEPAPHRVDAALFVRRAGSGADTHHLHLTVVGSDLWRERLAFRDALRADPALVREYADLKRRLLAASGGQPYTGADKRDFVRRVLASTGLDLRDGLHTS